MSDKQIYALGDIHGNWNPLIKRIDEYDIRDCTIICVGDIGLGFKSYNRQEEELSKVNEKFRKRRIKFFGIRGNHDDPHYFDGGYEFSNMEFLRDYEVRTFGEKVFQFIGGATSVDRTQRVEGVSYWEDEKFNFNPDQCVECDVLITHSAPPWNGPTDKGPIKWWCGADKNLWSELQIEREEHGKLFGLCKPSKHYCGHFHLSSTAKKDDCVSRILDIDELLDITHH